MSVEEDRRSRKGCDWKVAYTTLQEAEEAYWRTPPRQFKYGWLLPYRCERHDGYHLGHWDTLGGRAYGSWGPELYCAVNGFRARRHRKVAKQADHFRREADVLD